MINELVKMKWVQGVRDIRVEQKIETTELRIEADYFKTIMEKHIRELYDLPDDYDVIISICDTSRTDDVANIEIIRAVK